jgi:SH3-like domain-containing protein
LRADFPLTSKVVAYAQPGVVAKLKACKPAACEVETSGVEGWVDKKNIWGVELGEVFQ